MAKVDSAASRARNHDLAPLYIATFVLAAANGVVFPLLADIQDAYDLPTYGLGIISGTSFIASLIGLLVFSGQADRGRAKWLLLGGLGLSVVSLVAFALSTQLWQFTAARALSGLAIGCFAPATRSIVARLDSQNVGRNLGRLAGTELGGFVSGPVVGAMLASAFTLDTPFWVLAVIIGITFVFLAGRPIPGHEAGANDPSEAGGLAFDLLRYREVVVAALLALALFLPVGIYDSLWSRYLQDRGASTLFIGITLTMYGVPFIALASRGGRLADRVGPFRAAFVCVVLLAPAIALYGVFAIPVLIVSIAMIEAIVQAVAVPATQAAMAQACPPERLGAGQGLSGAAGQAGAGVVALVAAPVYESAGPTFLFFAAALTTLGIGAIAWLLHQRVDRSAERAPAQTVRGSIA